MQFLHFATTTATKTTINSAVGHVFVVETIPILRHHKFGLFPAHPLCQHKYSTKRKQNWPFSKPTHSFAEVINGWSRRVTTQQSRTRIQ